MKPDGNDEELKRNLLAVASGSPPEDGAITKQKKKKNGGVVVTDTLYDRVVRKLDERRSVKATVKAWTPAVELVVRVMLVATFVDDFFRSIGQFLYNNNNDNDPSSYTRWLTDSIPSMSDGAAYWVAVIVIGSGLFAECIGSACLVCKIQTDLASKALVVWTLTQPIVFGQTSNKQFVAQSLTLVGGLLTLRAQLSTTTTNSNATRLMGRLLLPSVYVYRAWDYFNEAFTLDETSDFAAFLASLSSFGIQCIAIGAFVVGILLVGFGLKSRFVALLLAIVNTGFVFYRHPFFLYYYYTANNDTEGNGGAASTLPIPDVALPDGVSPTDLESTMIYDLHKYYFFLGLSTSGALLLLAQFGPGDIASQKDEILLPITNRAQD